MNIVMTLTELEAEFDKAVYHKLFKERYEGDNPLYPKAIFEALTKARSVDDLKRVYSSNAIANALFGTFEGVMTQIRFASAKEPYVKHHQVFLHKVIKKGEDTRISLITMSYDVMKDVFTETMPPCFKAKQGAGQEGYVQ